MNSLARAFPPARACRHRRAGLSVSASARPPLVRRGGGDRRASDVQPLPGSLKKSPYLDSWIRIDCRRARSPCSPARPSSDRASRLRCCKSQPRSSMSPFDAITLITADTRQHRRTKATPPAAIPCRTAARPFEMPPHRCAVLLLIQAAAAARRCLSISSRQRTARSSPPMGGATAMASSSAPRCCTYRRSPTSALKDPASFKVMGTADPARRYPGEGHRRGRLRARPAAARHAARARGAAAELWRASLRTWTRPVWRKCREW